MGVRWMRAVGGLVACLVLATAGCSRVPGGAATPAASSQGSGSGSDTTLTSTKDELTVVVAGMITPKDGLQYYEGLSAYVASKVGKRVRLIHKASYTEANQMLKDGKVDAAFVCSGPYVAGHDGFGLQLLAAPVVDGKSVYRSLIIVPRSSPATSLASLRGKDFAFADPQSNSGKIVPTYMIGTQFGVTPERFFHKTFYTYSHDNSIKAVASGQADGAAVDSLIFQFDTSIMPQYTSKTRVLVQSDAYAIPPVVVPPGLSPGLKEQLRAAFLGADTDPAGKKFLTQLHIQRFVTIDDAAYDPIRRMQHWIDAHQAD